MLTPVILHTVGFRARQNSITNIDTLIDNHITDLASQTVIEKPRLRILAQSGSSIKDPIAVFTA